MSSVIDVGTNTIRAVKFDGNIEVENLSEKSSILEHTQNGTLTELGMCDLAERLKRLSDRLDDKPYVFATYAFRSLNNKDAVCEYIKDKIGIDIEILSGDEEAECDCISLKNRVGISEGVGIDLGGGSCQIFELCSTQNVAKSLPIGVKRLKLQFVKGIIPTADECNGIIKYIKNSINIKLNVNTIYVMGGTARAILKLKKRITQDKSSVISVEELKSIADFALDTASIQILMSILPERFDTVGIGATVIYQIANSLGATAIKIVDCSVREGYIIKKCEKNP